MAPPRRPRRSRPAPGPPGGGVDRRTARRRAGRLHHPASHRLDAAPGLATRPVIDLLGETADLATIDASRPALEVAGFRWRGENGVAGRRYLTRDDPHTGARAVHLQIHAAGDPMIPWRLAFRDRLRAEPETAAYEVEKRRCAALHPGDSGAYSACKKAWTDGDQRRRQEAPKAFCLAMRDRDQKRGCLHQGG